MSQYFDSINWSTNEELFDIVKAHECTEIVKSPDNFSMWFTQPNAIAWFQRNVDPSEWYIEHQKVVYVPGDPDFCEVRVVARFNEYYDILDFTIICCDVYNKNFIVPTNRKVWEHALKLVCQTVTPYQGNIVLPIQVWEFEIDGTTYTIKSYDGGNETRIRVEFENEDELLDFELPKDLKYISHEFEIGGNDLIDYWMHTRHLR